MKKNFKYALLGAIALTGAMTFSACQSSDEIVDNPNYNPETNTVKTQFAISIPVAGGQATRMEIADVQGQETPVFLGMQDIKLIAYNEVIPTTGVLSEGDTPTEIALPSDQLDDFTADLATESDALTKNHAKLYSDVEIPIQTKGFIFYGQSKATRSAAADYFKSGYLTAPTSFTGAPSQFKFTFNQTQSQAPTSNTVGTAIAAYLTSIIQTAGWKTAYDENPTSTSALVTLFKNFKELRAGSSATALAAVQKLYTELPTSVDLATTIKGNITAEGKASDDGSGTLTFDASLQGYPANINLPDGAALLTYSATDNSFSVADASAYASLNVGASTNYVYPPSLYYRANSAIQTSTGFQSDNYKAANNWAGILNYYTEGTEVTKNTHSVAIVDPIQYAVGRLDLTIQTEAATLKDKYGHDVTVPEGGFPVSAILIGNQKAVGFDFTPIETETEKTIYDKAMPTGMCAKYTTTPITNYTLALETVADVATYVVVELTNTTNAAFYGKDGLIPKDGKFYLVAKLDPANGVTGTSNQTNTGNRVFKQDFITTAALTIGANSTASEENPAYNGLGGAYNIIPDLRTTSFELGLSVNLQWRTGISFELNI